MRQRHHPETLAAILLLGLAALHALLGAAGAGPQGALLAAPLPRPLPPVGSSARKDMEWCLQNVAIIHDVYWASACAVDAREELRARRAACPDARAGSGPACDAGREPPDDSSDCTLPDSRARELNAARARAEQQCFDQAAAR